MEHLVTRDSHKTRFQMKTSFKAVCLWVTLFCINDLCVFCFIAELTKANKLFPSKHEVNIMYDMFIAWKGIALLLPGFSLNCDKCVKGPLCVCGHNQILDPLYIRAEVS